MNEALIRHEQRGKYAYILKNGNAMIMLEVGRNEFKRVEIVYYDKYLLNQSSEFKTRFKDMTYIGDGRFKSFYMVELRPIRNRLHYYFRLTDNLGNVKYFNASGLIDNECYNEFDLFAIPYLNLEDRVEVPEWARGRVCYQIFPDTFYKDGGFDEALVKDRATRFCGGTINGIRERIPYLVDLGIEILYMTPIFKASTNHRYDTIDYLQIDPMLGTKEDFKNLIAELHKNNIKVILDGVFNHTSDKFFAFKDILENQEKSKYLDWYYIKGFPVSNSYENRLHLNYDTFSFATAMPKLNTNNKDVKEYIFRVLDYWTINYNIDGWRLDVANEISLSFWREVRTHLKNIKNDILLIGESWNDSSIYLMGDTFDSVMNYLFRIYLLRLFEQNNPNINDRIKAFKEMYTELLVKYPSPAQDVLINLIASHDVDRLRDIYNDERIIRALTAIQLTLTGLPCIYYGDEMGLKNDSFYENRMIPCWDNINYDILAYYKRLIKLRKSNPSLAIGRLKFNDLGDGILSYNKLDSDNEVMIIINLGDNPYNLTYNYDVLFNTSKDLNKLSYLDIIIYKIR